MPITGVMPEPAVTKRSLAGLGQHELAGGLLEVEQRAGPGLADQVGADQAVGHGLDGDRDEAVATHAVGEGVGPPLADAVDVDADAEVLAGHVTGPVGTRLDHQGRGVLGLGGHRDDPAAQLGAGAERGEQVEEVGGHERVGGRLGQSAHVRAQARSRRALRRRRGRRRRRGGGPGGLPRLRGSRQRRTHVSIVSVHGCRFLTGRRESSPMFCSQETKMTADVPLLTPGQAFALDQGLVDLLRGKLPEVAEHTIAAVMDEVPSYAGAFGGPMGTTIEQAVQMALAGFLRLASRGRALDPGTPLSPALEGAYALGRGEARSGRSADALLSAYRVGARVAWRELAATAVANDVPADTVAASPSWSSPTSTSSPQPRSPGTPTSSRPPGGSVSAISTDWPPGSCAALPPTRWSPRRPAPTGAHPRR